MDKVNQMVEREIIKAQLAEIDRFFYDPAWPRVEARRTQLRKRLAELGRRVMDYLKVAREFLKLQIERDRDCVDELIQVLERVALEARIDERQMPMPYRYSAQSRLEELRARLTELKENEK